MFRPMIAAGLVLIGLIAYHRIGFSTGSLGIIVGTVVSILVYLATIYLMLSADEKREIRVFISGYRSRKP